MTHEDRVRTRLVILGYRNIETYFDAHCGFMAQAMRPDGTYTHWYTSWLGAGDALGYLERTEAIESRRAELREVSAVGAYCIKAGHQIVAEWMLDRSKVLIQEVWQLEESERVANRNRVIQPNSQAVTAR